MRYTVQTNMRAGKYPAYPEVGGTLETDAYGGMDDSNPVHGSSNRILCRGGDVSLLLWCCRRDPNNEVY